MEGEFNFSSVAPPVFDGDNYQMWAVCMETYLDALDLWEAVEEDYEVQPLPANPTVAQIKIYKEKRTRKSKAKACLFAAVSPTIFTRIMSLKSAKDIWDYLKEEYAGDERIKGMQVLNLIREFELQRMKDSETIKDYSDRLLSIANKVRLLGSGFTDSRIVEKILVTVPERYEATITTLENTKDLSKISLAELLNALQAPEQRRLMREDKTIEGALAAKHQNDFEGSGASTAKGKNGNQKKSYPPCQHCGKKGHPPFRCWRRPDAKCSKCNQLGHEAVICKEKAQQQEVDAQVADQEDEDQLFVASCFASSSSTESWLIDSGCTNHMTNDKELFRDLRPTDITKEILRVRMKGKSFSFDPIKEEHAAFPTETSNTEIWHKRLGHCHLQSMQLLKRKELTTGLPAFGDHLPNCNACQYGRDLEFAAPNARRSVAGFVHQDQIRLCASGSDLSSLSAAVL
ncbi:hypothetical protein F0562_024231 [Nyssa sinensis]|uniref:DUF4219 domain-containing protein n=1 Tax=Nyssa sinensis TaxID=561372 RepID=A0A5J5BCJ3_9ASTE|nr:hypothetical protein F0562_024231 [Nyssa sinensis]